MLLVKLVRAVLAALLLLLWDVNVLSSAWKIPSLLSSRQASAQVSATITMSALVGDLLAVITNATANSISSSLSTSYLANIETNTETITTFSALAPTSSQAARAKIVCEISQLLFGANVVTPSNPAYTSKEQENWSSTCWLPAACFISVQNNLELALALKLVTVFQATFAVRSVGHNPNAGFASVGQTGVVLDLSAMNEIVLSTQKDYVSVGPGATWDQVYSTLEQDQLTVVGGRVAGVGVGGLLLGGGMSHFSNYWGMACDNVKNFEVVLANSEIINANAQENPDLFRALKGGGPNFGIVTRYDLYTHPNYQVWYTFVIYSASESAAVLAATVQVQQAMAKDSRVGFFLSVNGGVFVAGMIYLGWVNSTPAAFSAFNAITPLAVAVPPTNGTAYSVSVAASTPGIANREIAAVTVAVDAALYNELFTAYQGIVNSVSVSSDYALAFTFQPVAPPSVTQSQQRGGNSLGVSPVAQSWLALVVQWTNTSENALAQSQLSQLSSSFQSAAKARGQLLGFEFMNDSGSNESPLKGYGSSNFAALTATCGKYDPNGVFQKLQNSGFLISKA